MTARLGTAARLIVLATLLACQRERAVPAASRAVVSVTGEVWRSERGDAAGGARQPITSGVVQEGELISTGEHGGAILTLSPAHTIEMGARAELEVHRENGRLQLEVKRGTVVSRSTAGDDVELMVLTPFGITRVPRGQGQASIGVHANGVHIEVGVGQISFVDGAGHQVTANADEIIEVRLGSVEVVRRGTEPFEVMFSAENGPLYLRGPGERQFAVRRAAPAPAGTEFRLGPGRAHLLAPGLRARLEHAAAGQVGDALRSGAGRRLAFTLTKGSATFSLDGGEAVEVVLGGGRAAVAVRATLRTTFSVAATGDGPAIAVLAGAAEVTVGDSRRRLVANERARLDSDGKSLAVTPAPLSAVILPTARDLRVYADALTDLTLSWPQRADVVMVEVATDAEFRDVVLAGRVAGSSITLPAPRRGQLHWRISPADSPGGKVLVGEATFQPDRRRSVLDLDRPRNLVRESGTATTVYFQGVVPALAFAFDERAGVAQHRLRIYDARDLRRPRIERLVTSTRASVEAGALVEGGYMWHVTPLDAAGRELAGGRMNRLDLVYDNTLTRLAIGRPKPDELVAGRALDALGVAPLGSKLFINGQPAPLDRKGRFALRVNRAPTLVFRLVGKNGAESYWIRKLRVPS